MGPVMAESLSRFFSEPRNLELIEKLEAVGVLTERAHTEAAASEILAGKTIILTGTLKRYTREQATQAVEARGGRVTSSVSVKTDYAVVGAAPGVKHTKALAHGVRCLNEAEFELLLAGRLPEAG